MQSFRRKYRITPEEEDVIYQRVTSIMKNLFLNNHEEKIQNAVENIICQKGLGGADKIQITYNIELDVSFIETTLAELRNGKNKSWLKKKMKKKY